MKKSKRNKTNLSGDVDLNTIFLIGFMGCGKTTVGKALAQKTSLPYRDMDDYIVEKLGMSIPQIFSEYGEEYFRKEETEAIGELGKTGGIISCGGGAMLKRLNRDKAIKYGKIVYIDTSFDTCYNRIRYDRNRPIANSRSREELLTLYNSRSDVYTDNCTVSVNGEDTPLNIADAIINIILDFKLGDRQYE